MSTLVSCFPTVRSTYPSKATQQARFQAESSRVQLHVKISNASQMSGQNSKNGGLGGLVFMVLTVEEGQVGAQGATPV